MISCNSRKPQSLSPTSKKWFTLTSRSATIYRTSSFSCLYIERITASCEICVQKFRGQHHPIRISDNALLNKFHRSGCCIYDHEHFVLENRLQSPNARIQVNWCIFQTLYLRVVLCGSFSWTENSNVLHVSYCASRTWNRSHCEEFIGVRVLDMIKDIVLWLCWDYGSLVRLLSSGRPFLLDVLFPHLSSDYMCAELCLKNLWQRV